MSFPLMLSKVKKVPRAVWMISLASLLLTAAAGMSFSVFGLFLEQLGLSKKDIGVIDGFLEGFGCCLKMFSGMLSDFLSRRKLMFALGALFTTSAKGIVLMTLSLKGLIFGRVIDRVGNGIQASPRDALIGDYAPPSLRGTCFGLRQAMGCLGTVLSVVLVSVLFRTMNITYETVFQLAFCAGLLAFSLIVLGVRDCPRPQRSRSAKARKMPFHVKDIRHLPKPYWLLIVVVGVFMLCRMSESLIILFARNKFALDDSASVRVMLPYNLAAVFAALIAGRLTDRCSSTKLMFAGTLATFASNLVMVYAPSFAQFHVGILLWGMQIGIMQSVFCAEISRFVPFEFRGTGFGIYYFVTALGVIGANYVCGSLIDSNEGERAFLYGACVSLATMVALLFCRHSFQKNLTKKTRKDD